MLLMMVSMVVEDQGDSVHVTSKHMRDIEQEMNILELRMEGLGR